MTSNPSLVATLPSKRLEGKVAIITGGASGIGASAAKLFCENGAKVVVADVQDQMGQSVVEKLGENNACYVHCDVSNEEEVSNLVNTTVAKYGQLDIMYNNAGIIDRNFREGILEAKKHDLDRILEVNLGGAFLGAKHAARVMIPRRQGCILFTASACVSIAGIATHSYPMSKYGILGLTRNLAAELGQHGIRVNCVSPSGVRTPMHDSIATPEAKKLIGMVDKAYNLKGKILNADDVARAALFLASTEDAGYVSGLNLLVDGGFSVVNPSLSFVLNRI